MLNIERLDKGELRKAFGKDYDSYYSTDLFKKEGFRRRLCKICGKNFWSISERDQCDDPEHTPYTFFKESPRPIGYVAFWKKFADFFSSNGHAVIDRYPVVSRWRQDLYFTIASIQDFQRIENGAMSFEYGANPLIVPQICLRFPDIENVGVTGRHFTSFMMAGQHAFNYPAEGYWRDRTIDLNFKFLTEKLGVKKENLIYNEDVWAMGDFSEFGPCLESFSNGVELVNSVFTQFEAHQGKPRELPSMVVDVGWGFERLLWFYTGFDNAYDAVFHSVIEQSKSKLPFELEKEHFKKFAEYSSELDVTEQGNYNKKVSAILAKTGISEKEYGKKIKPMQSFYAVLDHARTLLFAISDGALPSNIGGGYNLRVIMRRALSFIKKYEMDFSIEEIAAIHARDLKGLYPELGENLDILSEVASIEEKRYLHTTENANRIIQNLVQKNAKIGREELKTLYESNGITPELLASAASESGLVIEMPEGAYADLLKSDFADKKKTSKISADIEGLPATETLYYSMVTESESLILHSEKNIIVLDSTPFYPEGGGQEADHGSINGFEVTDVQKIGNVIVHIMKDSIEGNPKLSKGSGAICKVDTERRNRLMAHHTSTHLMSAAARHILGKHAWQEGTRKSFDKAHIDVSHYDKLEEPQISAMEQYVNSVITNGMKVTIEYMERGKTESEYGFSIYQGHGMPTKTMRMVIIRDLNGNLIDAEACGGLHVSGKEYSVGIVKIINTSRIHDGVDRIEFTAGNAALDYFRMEQNELFKTAKILNSDPFGISEKSSKLKEENKKLLKGFTDANERVAILISEEIYSKHIKSSGASEISVEIDEPLEIIRRAISALVEKNPGITAMATNRSGEVICMAGSDSKRSAIDLIREKHGTKFKGGGSKAFAQGILT